MLTLARLDVDVVRDSDETLLAAVATNLQMTTKYRQQDTTPGLRLSVDELLIGIFVRRRPQTAQSS